MNCKIKLIENVVFIVGTVIAILLRLELLFFKTKDYTDCLAVWYRIIIQYPGLGVLKYLINDYFPAYYYLLIFSHAVLPQMQGLFVIKGISIIFDIICAWYVYKIVQLKYENSMLPVIAYITTLFMPTVILNGSFWGQCDSIYTSFVIASIYYLLKRKQVIALVFLGLALSFKLQSIFILPLFIVLFARQHIELKKIIIVPVVIIMSFMPALLNGVSVQNLLSIFMTIINENKVLTLNAPNLYQWLPNGFFSYEYPAGLVFAFIVLAAFILFLVKHKVELTKDTIILISFASALLLPFVLPKMHERYFYLADVLSIIYVFYNPRYFFLILTVPEVSLLSYIPYLFFKIIIPLEYLAGIQFINVCFVLRQVLFVSFRKKK